MEQCDLLLEYLRQQKEKAYELLMIIMFRWFCLRGSMWKMKRWQKILCRNSLYRYLIKRWCLIIGLH